jgi:dephospho-CoA kinase
MWKLGLTGGIGCGKSTALDGFAHRGWRTHSADAIVADLYRSDEELRTALAENFGPGIVQADGIDRQALAKVAFADSEARKRLEELVHPRVRAVWKAALETPSEPGWVIEIPLLYEKKLETAFDRIVTVWASEEVVLGRLERRGLPPAQARERMQSQLPPLEKAERADHVLANHGSLSFLTLQMDRLDALLKASRPTGETQSIDA